MAVSRPHRLDRVLTGAAALVALAGTALGLLLLVSVGLAATQRDAAGLAALGLGFTAVPWLAVWAAATGRWLVAAGALALAGAGFAAIVRDGFPTLPAAVLAFALAAAAAWRGLRARRREPAEHPG